MQPIKEEIDALYGRANKLEDEFTACMGFVLPKTLDMDEAFQLLTAVNEPLRTEITTRLLTSSYIRSDWDIRWCVLSTLIRFGVRFGKMRDVVFSLSEDYYDLMVKTSDRVFLLLNEPERVSATRFPFLRSCVEGLLESVDDYDDRRLKMVNKENFSSLANPKTSRFASDQTFLSISGKITELGKRLCKSEKFGQDDLPFILRDAAYCDCPEALQAFKSQFCERVRMLKIFNEILDTF